jgi:hypothetical protein
MNRFIRVPAAVIGSGDRIRIRETEYEVLRVLPPLAPGQAGRWEVAVHGSLMAIPFGAQDSVVFVRQTPSQNA